MFLAVLNRAIAQDASLRVKLASYAGRAVRFALPGKYWDLIYDRDQAKWVAATTPVEATLSFPLAFFTAQLLNPSLASRRLALAGDTEWAAALAVVLGQCHWNVTGEVSRVLGPLLTHRLLRLGQSVYRAPVVVCRRATWQLAEYWRDEVAILAHPDAVATFCEAVHTVRHDTARLAKRLQHLLERRA